MTMDPAKRAEYDEAMKLLRERRKAAREQQKKVQAMHLDLYPPRKPSIAEKEKAAHAALEAWQAEIEMIVDNCPFCGEPWGCCYEFDCELVTVLAHLAPRRTTT